MLHIWNDWIPEMLNSVARFPQLRRRSDMTACEWETGFRRERLASMHFYLGKHECIQAGRNYCLAVILLWSRGSVQQVWGCPLVRSGLFCIWLPFNSPPTWLKKYVPSKCEQQEPNQLSFHAEWMASFRGRGHSFDLHYFKKNNPTNQQTSSAWCWWWSRTETFTLSFLLVALCALSTMWLKFGVFFFCIRQPPSFSRVRASFLFV